MSKLPTEYVRLPSKVEYVKAGYVAENYDDFIKYQTDEAAKRGMAVKVAPPVPGFTVDLAGKVAQCHLCGYPVPLENGLENENVARVVAILANTHECE